MSRRLSLLALWASTAFAAGGSPKDPKGEPRRDPHEQREELQRDRDNLASQRRMRFEQKLTIAGFTERDFEDLLRSAESDPARYEDLKRLLLTAAKSGSQSEASSAERKAAIRELSNRLIALRQSPEFLHEQAQRVQSRLAPHLNVLYRPLDSANQRLAAMADRSVPENSENWRAWLEISKSDSDSRVRVEAYRRAIQASPAYAVTRALSFEAQSALAGIDPLTLVGHRKLREIGEAALTEGDHQLAARKMLELFPAPVVHDDSLHEASWLHILSHVELKERDIKVFDTVDFRDASRAERDLRRLIEETRANADTRIASLARSVLARVNPPARGTVESVFRRHVETLPLALRDRLERALEGLDAELKATPPDIEKIRRAFDRVASQQRTELERKVASLVRELNADLLYVQKWQGDAGDQGMTDLTLNEEFRRRIEALSKEEEQNDE